ncbi:Zinc finger MYM-type protein 1 [Aphis craccivora]|uniref:Zinc finger MYM-type protein 1 n=1 Tax=Aphis craccivora TaxID=307492 RepID=A0A6G0ZIP0_APHCR|nr:Zinc finger MYM-type protein 1 [Aphis craccivora]
MIRRKKPGDDLTMEIVKLKADEIDVHKVRGKENSLQEIYDMTVEANFTNITNIIGELQISTILKESRKKAKIRTYYETDYNVKSTSAEQNFRISIIDSINSLLTQIIWWYEKVMEISNDFESLFLSFIN